MGKRGKERREVMKNLVMCLLLLVILVSPIFAAPSLSSISLDDHFTLPGLQGGWWTNNKEEQAKVSVYLNLEDHKVQNAGWSFYVRDNEPSEWWAVFSASGFLLNKEETPVYISREEMSKAKRGPLLLVMNTSLDKNTFVSEDKFHVCQRIRGSFSLMPARIDFTDFSYDEYQALRTWWHSSFYMEGTFLAETIKEARALGAQFAEVPEPATLCLLGLGAASIIFRRRHKPS